MRAAGRLAAAIEILEIHAAGDYPARLVLSTWARGNRYAGSKDRAAIANLVFDVLRRAGSYGAYMKSQTSRSLALAAILDSWGFTLQELDELCDGSQYAPPPLSEDEKAGLARLAEQTPLESDPAALADLPAWLYPSLEAAFGERTVAEGQALAQRAPIDLRVNRLKVKRSTVSKPLAALAPVECAELPDALRIAPPKGPDKSPRLEQFEGYKRGWFEVQDLGSQMVSALSGVKSGMQVLDLCAGSGGKTLAMAAMMGNKGQIYAYDNEQKRLSPIAERLKRAGAHNVRVLPCGNQGALDKLAAKMEVVLVDAPCTGSGTWRRKPDSKARLTKIQLEERLKEQRAVLAQGAKAVKAGGRLVYVTCSILPQENEQQIKRFLEENKEFALLSPETVWNESQSTPAPKSAIPTPQMLQLTPAQHGTDGFFVAILQRG